MPTINIFAGSISGNAVTLDADVGDADGFGDLVSVTCMTTAGNHVGQARFNPNETASCDITLPAGNWTIIMSVTDRAGWTTSATSPESI